MGEVLPLCASPRSLLLSAASFYQEVRQSLKTVGSSFKKFRWAFPGPNGRSTGGAPLAASVNMWWFMFGLVPAFCMIGAFICLMGDQRGLDKKQMGDQRGLVICAFLKSVFVLGAYIVHFVALYSVIYWYRDMPFQLIGAETKFMIEVIPMITAAALHHLLPFNYGYLALMLGCTTYIYAFGHFMHITYDIRGRDVLMGILMQVLAYMVNGELLVRALTLSFCSSLCIYRYSAYCAPEVPAHGKKELERLPY